MHAVIAHRERDTLASFVALTTASGRQLRLSDRHFLPVCPAAGDDERCGNGGSAPIAYRCDA
jgi:hypothetical protein